MKRGQGAGQSVRRISRRRSSRDTPVYEARTHDVLIRVVASYLPDQSSPEESQYFWAYTVEIENHTGETIQLVSRRWIITDGLNRIEEVAGAGVVGEQPELRASEAYRYTSGVPLTTPSGSMRGSYQMVTKTGRAFDVDIPEFSLHLPGAGRVVN